MWSNSRGKTGDFAWRPEHDDLQRIHQSGGKLNILDCRPHWIEYVIRSDIKNIKLFTAGIDMNDGKLLNVIENHFWSDDFHYDQKRHIEITQHPSCVNQLSLNVE